MNTSGPDIVAPILDFLGEITQFLSGASLGLAAGGVLGFLLSEWVKHKFRKAQQTQKAELDSLLEQKKSELSQVLESYKFSLSQELELFKETIKLQNSFKAGIAQGLSKGASEEISNTISAINKADAHLAQAFYSALAKVPDIEARLLQFEAELSLCSGMVLSPISSTIPKEIVDAFSSYCVFLSAMSGLLKTSLQNEAPNVNELYGAFCLDRIAQWDNLRTLLHNPA